jgi:NodT family efflux transporter outer membrane factor (OMF) lipoprotein
LVLFLTSCTTGPDYFKPSIHIPEKYKEADGEWKIAQPQDDKNHGSWWNIFNDPNLNKLVEQVDISNQNVAGAAAQYQQALALVSQARSAYFPTVGGSLATTREKTSLSSQQSSRTPFTLYNSSLNASWEPDIWGSISRSTEASEAGAEASASNLAAVQLSMQGSLVQTYFQLRALDAIQKTLDDAVDSYQKLLTYTLNRYAKGVASKLDVVQAESQLQTAQAQAADNRVNRATYEHAIAVLIGKSPSEFSILPAVLELTPPDTPFQVPSALLERRPDIAQAERLMAQTNAQIGVAISAYFPIFTLTAAGGYESYSFAKWFSSPPLFWSLGPQLAATFFDGGLRSAKVDAARAAYDQSVATYRQTVLTAFQDVEDNLATLRILRKEKDYQRAAVESAQKALTITKNQYKAGTATIADILNAMITLYTTQKNAITIAGRQMVAAAGFVKALGGGW